MGQIARLKHLKILFFTFFLLLASILGQLTAVAQTVVGGKVLAERDSSPVPFAAIIIDRDTVFTDSLGHFFILNQNKAKLLRVISSEFPSQSVVIGDSNEYALTILLADGKDKFVKSKQNKGRDIEHVNKLQGSSNDTAIFMGTQGKFKAFVFHSISKEPLEATSFYMREMEDGNITDSMGYIELLFEGDTQRVTIDALGYLIIDTVIVSNANEEPAIIYLQPIASELDGVTVYARKKRYRNKNNPAVALVRKVIDKKTDNRMLANEDAQFEVYDKMVLYVSNMPRFIKFNPFFNKIKVLFENEDTTLIPKRKLLPLFLAENLTDHYYRANTAKMGTVQKAEKRIRFDSRLIESNNISSFLDRLYDQIDIYDDKIRVLNNYFLSPIAPAAPTFYKFFIVDTAYIDNRPIVQLRFEPRNKQDFLFEGRIYVSLSPDYAVTKVDMQVPKHTPLNWTSGLSIRLGFDKQSNGKYWQTSSRYLVNFGLFNSKRGVVGLRYVDKGKYIGNAQFSDSVFDVKQTHLEFQGDTLYQRSNEYWQAVRPEPLTYFEQKAYHNIDSLRDTKGYRNLIKTMSIIGSGHFTTKYVEFGSIYDVISYNPIEGMKLRLGGRTNIKNLQQFLLEGYGAYGFGDKRFKYYLGGTISLNNKYVFGFPKHNVHLSYQYDVRAPGQALGFNNQEKAYELVRRGDGNRYLYNKLFTLLYTKEFQNRMTLNFGYNNWQQEAAGSLYFEKANGTKDTIKNLLTNELSLEWRFSPGERFVQNKRYRTYNENRAWVFNLKATAGFNKGYSADILNYQKLEAKIEKRLFLPPFGNAYVVLNAGYLFGEVPYTYLFTPRANQSYVYKISAYNLMNFMEFATDKYVSINIDYHMKGFLLSRIPLVKKMYLREVFGFKALYGGIRKTNLPQNNGNLLLFPVNDQGRTIVNSFGNQPYVEASVGVENVFRMMRLDFVRRFTYTDLPTVNTYGIRFSFGLDF